MAGPEWYKRDPKRALRGMRGLRLELRGFYQTLQDLIYDEGGPIEDDERFLAGQMIVSLRKYRALRDELIAAGRIIRTADGRLYDEACRETLEDWLRVNSAQREGGAKGGSRAKTKRKSSENVTETIGKNAENEARSRENNHLAEAKLTKSSKSSNSTTADAVAESAPARDRPLDRCLSVAGPGLADPAKHPSLHLSAARIAAAIAAGCDFELDILPVVAARTARQRASPITTWSYFERAWADARDARLAGFAPADPNRFNGAPDGQTFASTANRRRNTGSKVDAALRLIDRARRADADNSDAGLGDGAVDYPLRIAAGR